MISIITTTSKYNSTIDYEYDYFDSTKENISNDNYITTFPIQNLRTIEHSLILGIGILLIIICSLITILRKKYIFNSIKFYSLNLIITNTLLIINIFLSYSEFNISNTILPINILIIYQDNYKEIEECLMTIYPLSTCFFLYDIIINSKRKSTLYTFCYWIGIYVLQIILSLTIVLYVKKINTSTIITPPPLATYYLLSFLLFQVLFILSVLKIVAIKCYYNNRYTIKCRNEVNIIIFIIITMIFQYPYLYICLSEFLLNTFKMEQIIDIIRILNNYNDIVVIINSWTILLKPAIEILSILLFLPGYKLFNI